MTVEEFIADYIKRWEGGLSVDPVDSGNHFNGKLVGSKYGVTGAALASHRGVKDVSAKDMENLTLGEAVQIGKRAYYDAPNLDLLPWNRVTASILDFAWGTGPKQAIKILQRLVGVADDGVIGPATVRAYRNWLEADKAEAWAGKRNAFYELIIKQRPANKKYERGWKARTAYFTPASEWWGRA